MSEYVVLIPGDEQAWAALPEADKARMYARHREFSEALASRGHQVTKGAELMPSATAHIVSGSRDDVVVTSGPYAESAEQLTGFYVVESSDLDDLLACVAMLAEGDGRLEVRACVGGDAS